MKIEVWVKAGAKIEWIEERQGQQNIYDVSVKEKPKDGRANEAVIKVLAHHFNVRRSDVVLIRGESSRRKQFQIHAQKAKTKKQSDAAAWRNA